MIPKSSRDTVHHASSQPATWYRQLFHYTPYPALVLARQEDGSFFVEEGNEAAAEVLDARTAAAQLSRLESFFGDAWHSLSASALASDPQEATSTDQVFPLPQQLQALDLTASPLDANRILLTWRSEASVHEASVHEASVHEANIHEAIVHEAIVHEAPEAAPSDDSDVASWNKTMIGERLYQETPIKVYLIDEQARIVAANDFWLDTMGYTRDEVVGEPISSFLTPASESYVRDVTLPALQQVGAIINAPYQYIRKDGSIYSALVSASCEFNEDGSLRYALSALIDASDQDETVQDLLRQQHLLHRAEEIAKVGHWEVNMTTMTPQWSREVYRIHGHDPATYTPTLEEAINAYHPGDRDRVNQVVTEAIEQGKPFEFELRLIRPDGEIRHVQSRGECTVNDEGITTSIFGVFLDITESKRHEEALAAEKQRLDEALKRYELLASNMQDLVCLHEPDGTYLWISPSVKPLLGYSPEELIGTSPYALFHSEDLERIRNGSHQTNLDGDEAYISYRIRTKDGQNIWFETLSSPITDEAGEVVQIQTQTREITRRMEALDALRRSEERFNLAVEGSNDGLWDWDLPSGKVWYSDRMIELLRWDPEEFPHVFESWENTLHPDDHGIVLKAVEAHLTTKAPYDVEYRCCSKKGEYRWFRARGQAIWDNDGQPLRMAGSMTDIHEKKLAEEELQRERERFELAVLGADLGTWDADLNAALFRYNERWAEMLGYTLEEVDADPDFFYKNIHPSDLEKVWAAIDAQLAGELPLIDEEIRIRHKDGQWRWILDRGKVVTTNPDGRPARIVGTHMDITDRKHTADALRIREERMRLLYELSSLTEETFEEQIQTALHLTTELLGLDIGILSKVDEAQESYTVVQTYAPGIDLEPGATFALGQTYCSILLATDGVLAINHMSDSIYYRHPCYEAFKLETYIGIPIYANKQLYGTINFSAVEARATPFSDIDQELLHLLSQWMTAQLERHEVHVALETYADELKRSNAELEQFAYIASHDLQEPLRTIRSFIGLLEKKYANQFDEQGETFLQFITESAERMQTLIKDILAYSRVGRKETGKEAVPLNELFARTRESLLVTLDEQNATVTSDMLPTVQADPSQLGVLFQNLITNGIKFRGEDNPAVHVSAERKGKMWQISVSDNGIGIPERQHDRIFEVFKRLHRREEYQGNGIGLAICKKVVERHGGRIWVTSTPGEGATFHFTLRAS